MPYCASDLNNDDLPFSTYPSNNRIVPCIHKLKQINVQVNTKDDSYSDYINTNDDNNPHQHESDSHTQDDHHSSNTTNTHDDNDPTSKYNSGNSCNITNIQKTRTRARLYIQLHQSI